MAEAEPNKDLQLYTKGGDVIAVRVYRRYLYDEGGKRIVRYAQDSYRNSDLFFTCAIDSSDPDHRIPPKKCLTGLALDPVTRALNVSYLDRQGSEHTRSIPIDDPRRPIYIFRRIGDSGKNVVKLEADIIV